LVALAAPVLTVVSDAVTVTVAVFTFSPSVRLPESSALLLLPVAAGSCNVIVAFSVTTDWTVSIDVLTSAVGIMDLRSVMEDIAESAS
jgi:hypothetical protein